MVLLLLLLGVVALVPLSTGPFVRRSLRSKGGEGSGAAVLLPGAEEAQPLLVGAGPGAARPMLYAHGAANNIHS